MLAGRGVRYVARQLSPIFECELHTGTNNKSDTILQKGREAQKRGTVDANGVYGSVCVIPDFHPSGRCRRDSTVRNLVSQFVLLHPSRRWRSVSLSAFAGPICSSSNSQGDKINETLIPKYTGYVFAVIVIVVPSVVWCCFSGFCSSACSSPLFFPHHFSPHHSHAHLHCMLAFNLSFSSALRPLPPPRLLPSFPSSSFAIRHSLLPSFVPSVPSSHS